MHKRRLQAKMKIFGDTQATLAEGIGISLARLNAKINCYNGAEFTAAEIKSIKTRYNLSSQELCEIFFCD